MPWQEVRFWLLFIISITFFTFYVLKPQNRAALTNKQKSLYKQQFSLVTLVGIVGILFMSISVSFGAIVIGAGITLISIRYLDSGIAFIEFSVIKGEAAKKTHIIYIILGSLLAGASLISLL